MAIMLRAKCPKCGELVETQANCYCGRCGTPISFAGMGMVQIYRMGSPVGIAVGYGIYLDGQPFGHIANKKSIRIPVPFGTHTLHITCGMTRRCQDLTFTLTPQRRLPMSRRISKWACGAIPSLSSLPCPPKCRWSKSFSTKFEKKTCNPAESMIL